MSYHVAVALGLDGSETFFLVAKSLWIHWVFLKETSATKVVEGSTHDLNSFLSEFATQAAINQYVDG